MSKRTTRPTAEPKMIADWRQGSAGDTLTIPLKPNPNAPYIISDNTILITPPPTAAEAKLGQSSGSLEVLFMRTSIDPVSQEAVLESADADSARVGLGGFHMAPYSQELGRARMDVDSAINLATAILKQAVDHNGVPIEVIAVRLLDRGLEFPQISES